VLSQALNLRHDNLSFIRKSLVYISLIHHERDLFIRSTVYLDISFNEMRLGIEHIFFGSIIAGLVKRSMGLGDVCGPFNYLGYYVEHASVLHGWQLY
jgi:hypothetical protein